MKLQETFDEILIEEMAESYEQSFGYHQPSHSLELSPVGCYFITLLQLQMVDSRTMKQETVNLRLWISKGITFQHQR